MRTLASIQSAAISENLTPAELEELAAIGRERSAAKGDRLFKRGEEADSFFLVRDGQFVLTLQLRVLDDHVEVPVEAMGPGDAFGWSALVAPFRWVYSAYCTRDGSLVCFPRDELDALLSADTHLGYRFSRNLSQLMGNRIRAVQGLWMEEIQQSMARVDYWTHTRLSEDWSSAVRPQRKHGHWWPHSSA